MPRPVKSGLDYFPVDNDIDQDDKIYMIEAELGEIAFARLIKLLAAIYREGYYKTWTEEDALVFAGKKRIPIDELHELISVAMKRRFFDPDLFERYQVLTSHGIQKRYARACDKRKSIVFEAHLFLLTETDLDELPERIKGKITTVKVEKTPVISTSIPQSKGKERKGKQQLRERVNSTKTPVNSPETDPPEEAAAAGPEHQPELRAELERAGVALRDPDVDAIAGRLVAHGVGPPYVAWARRKANGKGNLRDFGAFFRKALLEYDDWLEEYQAEQRAEQARARASPLTVCPACGGQMVATTDMSRCRDCGSMYELVRGEWQEAVDDEEKLPWESG